ncbi:MAG TPA: hypothetical protein PK743_04490 [Luteimonas sp.]|nr:hypothetical protein [Luteimonas sp.]HRO27505.1 hypothetical protein [Luteimonas sp.]HRP71882.1 hypothetical protein [Luteimonas sp.]
MTYPLRTVIRLAALSILSLACASVAAQRNATTASPGNAAATGYADYLPGCKQRLGAGYSDDSDRWCQHRWQMVQASQPLVETIYQALQLAAQGMSDAALPQSLPLVAWEPASRPGSPRTGQLGDLAVSLPALNWDGQARPRTMSFQWGGFHRFVWELEEALHARGDDVQQLGCWGGGGEGVTTFRVASRDSGGRPFALHIREIESRAGYSTEITLELDGSVPTRQQLQAENEGYQSCD